MDWQSLITDLMGTGYSQVRIGEKIGLSQAAVSDLARGRTGNVTWDVGQKLIALHRRRMAAHRRKEEQAA